MCRSPDSLGRAHDLMIASTAVMLGFKVATRDAQSFPKIKGLDILYW